MPFLHSLLFDPHSKVSLYSLMNYADIKGGTWYPEFGMYSIVDGMVKVAKSLGVEFKLGEEVMHVVVENGTANKVVTSVNNTGVENSYSFDVLIGAGDYHHIETNLLEKKYQSYSKKYWDSRVLAPSSLLFYVGLNKKLNGVTHHSLFFDTDFSVHGNEIYNNPMWPSNPLFYASVPSVTDASLAPVGCENLFFLVPIAPDLKDDDEIREKYFDILVKRLKDITGNDISQNIVYKRSYCINDFKGDYHAFKGNAYGLANTLLQTAILKPSLKNKKLKNFYYTGQLTVPGPGVPPSIISGEVVAKQIAKDFKN